MEAVCLSRVPVCFRVYSKDGIIKVKKYSFPKPLGPHRAALISISLALSQTPAEAARPWIQG